MSYSLMALIVLLGVAGGLALWVNYVPYKLGRKRGDFKGWLVKSRRARLAKATETVFMPDKRMDARFTNRGRVNAEMTAELAKWRVQDELSISSVVALENALSSATDERPMQRALEKHPEVLSCFVHGHNGVYVIPQAMLGNQYVPDFLIAAETSLGLLWTLVELESPTAPLIIGDGQHSKQLRKAIKQITDWREWLGDNSDYARRNVSENGLGLRGIRSDAHAVILISRADMSRAPDRLRIRELSERNIEIRTYDCLIRSCQKLFPDVELLNSIISIAKDEKCSLLDITAPLPSGAALTKLIIERLHHTGAPVNETRRQPGTTTHDD